MEEQTSWRAIPFNDGYKIIYNDEFIEISIVIENPKDIEKTQQKILMGLHAINGIHAQANELPPPYQDLCQSISFLQELAASFGGVWYRLPMGTIWRDLRNDSGKGIYSR